MCEIIMLIVGLIALVRGRFSWTRAKEVRGWPARMVGAILVMPFPLSFLAGIVLGAIFLAMGKDIQDRDFNGAAVLIEVVIVAGCFLVAMGLAMKYAEPIRKNQSEGIATAMPNDYGERFRARVGEEPESQDITRVPSRHPTSREDRIQE